MSKYQNELFEVLIMQRTFVENIDDDLLKVSIKALKNEKKRRMREDFKFALYFILGGR